MYKVVAVGAELDRSEDHLARLKTTKTVIDPCLSIEHPIGIDKLIRICREKVSGELSTEDAYLVIAELQARIRLKTVSGITRETAFPLFCMMMDYKLPDESQDIVALFRINMYPILFSGNLIKQDPIESSGISADDFCKVLELYIRDCKLLIEHSPGHKADFLNAEIPVVCEFIGLVMEEGAAYGGEALKRVLDLILAFDIEDCGSCLNELEKQILLLTMIRATVLHLKYSDRAETFADNRTTEQRRENALEQVKALLEMDRTDDLTHACKDQERKMCSFILIQIWFHCFYTGCKGVSKKEVDLRIEIIKTLDKKIRASRAFLSMDPCEHHKLFRGFEPTYYKQKEEDTNACDTKRKGKKKKGKGAFKSKITESEALVILVDASGSRIEPRRVDGLSKSKGATHTLGKPAPLAMTAGFKAFLAGEEDPVKGLFL